MALAYVLESSAKQSLDNQFIHPLPEKKRQVTEIELLEIDVIAEIHNHSCVF